MTREDVIRIAIEVGFYDGEVDKCQLMLERFAYLVAQQEREECKKLCTWKTGNQFVDEAVAVCYRAIDQKGQA